MGEELDRGKPSPSTALCVADVLWEITTGVCEACVVHACCVFVYSVTSVHKNFTLRQLLCVCVCVCVCVLGVRQVGSVGYLRGDAGAPAHALFIPPP